MKREDKLVMKMWLVVFAVILMGCAAHGCMVTTANWQELAEREYQQFCNEQPDHLRCQGDNERV